MSNTIIITGANGSLAIPAVEYLLEHTPTSKLVLTVRDASDSDANTKTLREVIAKHLKADTSIRELDLSKLSAVHDFARSIADEITAGSLPRLSSIVGTAYYWNLSGPFQMTEDGYEKTFQVSYLSHFALVLRLLGSFKPEGGRIVLFTSDGHETGKNGLEKIPPFIPTDPAELELLVKPPEDDPSIGSLGHGFHRYANAKLATVMFTHALNRRLKDNEQLKNITVVVTNPGNLADSRALRVNTPVQVGFSINVCSTTPAALVEHEYVTSHFQAVPKVSNMPVNQWTLLHALLEKLLSTLPDWPPTRPIQESVDISPSSRHMKVPKTARMRERKTPFGLKARSG